MERSVERMTRTATSAMSSAVALRIAPRIPEGIEVVAERASRSTVRLKGAIGLVRSIWLSTRSSSSTAASAGLAALTSTRVARAAPGKDPGPCAPGSAAAAQARSKSAVGRPIPRICRPGTPK